ncbi:MAG: ABC transporter ATP-binding protein [Bacilli bacterium]|nr:ABC transporter ATP-binding protein [Bacilli bacterium]
MFLLEIKKLSKNFKHFKAINEIDFNVKESEIFAFLGPNGAGKSTTMNILSTLDTQSSGDIYFNHIRLNKRQRKDIGIVFQDNILDEEFSVYDNLKIRGSLYIKDKEQLNQALQEIISLLNLEPILNKQIKICSGGQVRLANIGRAILYQPKLLILDEPTTGLDPNARKIIWDVLKKLKVEKRITIFFTSHYMDEAMIADHICIINKGKIISDTTLPVLFDQYAKSRLIIQGEQPYEKNDISTKEALYILNHYDKAITNFELKKPSLDEIFISLTKE